MKTYEMPNTLQRQKVYVGTKEYYAKTVTNQSYGISYERSKGNVPHLNANEIPYESGLFNENIKGC
ncbi:hypothetical protein NSS70_19095 [Aeribacillus sp. FSL K6-2848]|jgi:hypothetical protein|uniref:hypothetical protein n=1 Tax=unclassified Aeribacillus TaxID=2640495 RepID=UPI002871A1E0|nr:hypothetical protein [Aeribacillus pallidus]